MRRKSFKRRTTASEPIRARAADGFSNPMARLGIGTPNLMEGTAYPLQRITRNYNLLNSLYREHWIVRQIIDVIPADMLKNWITLTTEVSPALLKEVDLELRKTQLIQKLKVGLQWGRLFGGAIGVMMVAGQGNDLSEPLDLSRMLPGDFCGLMIFDRWNSVDPSVEVVDDIRAPEFGLPKYYTVTDTASGALIRVHYSRVLRFIGDDLPYWEAQAEQQWGASGNGKTHLCIAVLQQIKQPHIYWQYRREIQRMKNAMYRDGPEYNRLMGIVKSRNVLYIDDLFKASWIDGRLREQDEELMFDVINERYMNRYPTFFSSEYSLAQIGQCDEALASRIVEMVYPYSVEVKGENQRYNAIKGG